MKVKITKIYLTDKKKDGSPLVNKFGKPYKKLAIKTNVHGDKWVSGFVNQSSDSRLAWKEGDEVDIVVEEKDGFLNMATPKEVPPEVAEMKDAIRTLELRVTELERLVGGSSADNGDELPDF